MIERRLTNITVAFHLMKLMPFYISGRNHAKSFLLLSRNFSINRKCQNVSNSNFSRDFWHLVYNISKPFTSSSFHTLHQPDGLTTDSSSTKADLLAQTFATNSTLDDIYIPPTLHATYYIASLPLLASFSWREGWVGRSHQLCYPFCLYQVDIIVVV